MDTQLVRRVLNKWRRKKSPMSYTCLSDEENSVMADETEMVKAKKMRDDVCDFLYEKCNGGMSVVVAVGRGKEKRSFQVKKEMLTDEAFEGFLQKSEIRIEENAKEGMVMVTVEECDSILFDHILWLVSNRDRSLLKLNLDLQDLIEFYSS